MEKNNCTSTASTLKSTRPPRLQSALRHLFLYTWSQNPDSSRYLEKTRTPVSHQPQHISVASKSRDDWRKICSASSSPNPSPAFLIYIKVRPFPSLTCPPPSRSVHVRAVQLLQPRLHRAARMRLCAGVVVLRAVLEAEKGLGRKEGRKEGRQRFSTAVQ